MRELIKAVQYFHSKDMVHLNLNLQNILVLRKNTEHLFNQTELSQDEIDSTTSNLVAVNSDEIEDDISQTNSSVNQLSSTIKESNFSNILIKGFCQASGFTKKLKFPEIISDTALNQR